jgi:hypothetical protein
MIRRPVLPPNLPARWKHARRCQPRPGQQTARQQVLAEQVMRAQGRLLRFEPLAGAALAGATLAGGALAVLQPKHSAALPTALCRQISV